MADPEFQGNDNDPDTDQRSEGSRLRQFAEETQAQNRQLQAQLAEVQRREAFRDAGLDPTNKLHQAAMKAYDGDLAAEAVKTYVEDLGLGDITQGGPSAEEQAAYQRVQQAAAGGTAAPTGGPTDADIDDEMRQVADQAFREKWMPQRLDQELVRLSRKGGRQTAWDR